MKAKVGEIKGCHKPPRMRAEFRGRRRSVKELNYVDLTSSLEEKILV